MARKSARLDAKADIASTTQLMRNEAQATEKSQSSRNSKRRKISHEIDASSDNAFKSNRRWTKRKRGDSKFPEDVPLDVLVEIFRLLKPIDLLYLSRVSKSLHGLLSSSDMIFLWKLVYENIDEGLQPPPCPDHINIVFYTNYLYGRHCQFCCSIHGQIYHDSALFRLCSKCADNRFLSVDGLHPSITSLCNVSSIPKLKHAGQVVLKAEYDLRTKEFNHACEKKEAENYSRNRKIDVQNRVSFSDLLGNWRKEGRAFQLLQLRAIRAKRELDIQNRLEAEGYKDDFESSQGCFEVYRIPHVRKSHALTDSEWNIIRADILDYFQGFRDGQALYDMQDKLSIRVGLLEAFIQRWEIRPTSWWIVMSSEPIASFIKSLLKRDMVMEDFEKFKPELRNLIASWKEETDCYLASLISDVGMQKNSHKHKTNRLKLATTFFKCHHCAESVSYPDILKHGCFIFVYGESESDDDDENRPVDFKRDVIVKTREPRGPREPRPPKHITADMVLPMLSDSHSLGMYSGKKGVSFDEEAFDAAWDIITTCGEDPNTVTHDAMKKIKARLECLRCIRVREGEETRLAMKWTTALVHERVVHTGEPSSSGPLWRKIEGPETTTGKKQQKF